MKMLVLLLTVGLFAFVGCDKPKQIVKKPETKYPVITAQILQAIPDNELDYAIVDHVSGKIGGDYNHSHQIVTSMSKGFQMVYSTWWVDAEVNNGGFNQYFWNSAGEFRNEALEGFKLLGAVEHETLMAEAIEVYKVEESKIKQQKAKGTMEGFSESYKDNPLNKLDDRFYKLAEDAGKMRVKFIREHPDLFISN
jgi:hypothetical protein